MKKDVMFEEKLLVEVIVFYKNMNKYLTECISKESSLNTYEIFFLIYLEGSEGLTYYDLTKMLPFDQSYINKMLKRLEEKGYVYRIKDGKKKKILLTNHCKKKLSKRSQAKIEFVELLEKNNISLEELRIFAMSLKKISDVLGQATE